TIGSWGVQRYGGAAGIPRPSVVVLQYTGHSEYNRSGEPATFVTVGESDGIANYQTMKRRVDNIAALGVATEYHSYRGLAHGFGLGIGTIAEGWFDQAVDFWMRNRSVP
ncbi:MAG: alpha/beta hydrolase, partial [Christensenellaceae bacterium]